MLRGVRLAGEYGEGDARTERPQRGVATEIWN